MLGQQNDAAAATPSKRAFDVTVSALGLVLCAPLIAVIAMLVKWDSPGPVLYRGVRLGKDGKPFSICKFRTMVVDAASKGAGITTRGDPRITRVGAYLRRWKLDELPQLWNVLTGEMSLVGPRPEDPRYLPYYTPAQRAVLRAQPGITGAASVTFRHEEELLAGPDWQTTYLQILDQKLNIELAYLQRRTFWSDLGLVLRTITLLFEPPNHDYTA